MNRPNLYHVYNTTCRTPDILLFSSQLREPEQVGTKVKRSVKNVSRRDIIRGGSVCDGGGKVTRKPLVNRGWNTGISPWSYRYNGDGQVASGLLSARHLLSSSSLPITIFLRAFLRLRMFRITVHSFMLARLTSTQKRERERKIHEYTWCHDTAYAQ